MPKVVMFGWFDVTIDPLIVAALIWPVTVKALKFPNDVMLFNVPGANTPLKVPPTILPVTARLPVTVAPVKPPNVVMLFCSPAEVLH